MTPDANAQFLPEVTSRLSESEVRIAGLVSTNLIVLRSMLASPAGGTIQTNGGTLKLIPVDAEAVIALLIERSEQYLTSLEIAIDGPIARLTAR